MQLWKRLWYSVKNLAIGSALILMVVGCASNGLCKKTAANILDIPHGKFCWVPKGSPVFGHKENCANARAKPSLQICLDTLERTSHWYSPSDEFEGRFLQCMKNEGWDRSLIEGYIVTLG
jgi:hypothetical protein